MANKTRKASAGKTPTRAAHAHTPPASSSNLVDEQLERYRSMRDLAGRRGRVARPSPPAVCRL